MDKNSRIYLSGSMSNKDRDQAFQEVSLLLSEAGFTNTFNPNVITYTDERFTGKPANGFREQVSHLTECDAVVFFGEWQTARGCIAELLNAVLFGCETFTLDRTRADLLKPLNIHRNNVNRVIADMLQEQDRAHHLVAKNDFRSSNLLK